MSEKQEPEQLKPVSYPELLGRCMGEDQFARTVLRGFIESSPPQLKSIREDIARMDWDNLVRKIHRFKGTAATVAANPLRKTLETLEYTVREKASGWNEESVRTLDEAERELNRLMEYVQREIVGD